MALEFLIGRTGDREAPSGFEARASLPAAPAPRLVDPWRDPVQDASEQSFPASDPPTLGAPGLGFAALAPAPARGRARRGVANRPDAGNTTSYEGG